MAADWWKRLPPARRRIYERSDAIGAIPLRPDAVLRADVGGIDRALRAADAELVAETSQKLVADICRTLGVPGVRVELRQGRPHDQRGELHGLYEAWSDKRVITMWMRTARRNDVVAPRTYLRTLLHEVCHHLDFHLLHLEESFHSTGFFRRESSMVRALLPPSNRPTRRRLAPPGAPGRAVASAGAGALREPTGSPRASIAPAGSRIARTGGTPAGSAAPTARGIGRPPPPTAGSSDASAPAPAAEKGLSLLLATLDALEQRRAAERAGRASSVSPPPPATPAPAIPPEPHSGSATADPPRTPRRDPRRPPDT